MVEKRFGRQYFRQKYLYGIYSYEIRTFQNRKIVQDKRWTSVINIANVH